MKRVYTFLVLAILIVGCSKDNSSELIEINIKDAFDQKPEILYLSEITDDIDYVFLETKDSCLIGRIRSMDISENFIIIHTSDTNLIFLFSIDGKFITRIGRIGKGPGEYKSIKGVKILNDESQVLIWGTMSKGNGIQYFNIEGQFINEVNPTYYPQSVFEYNKRIYHYLTFPQSAYLNDGYAINRRKLDDGSFEQFLYKGEKENVEHYLSGWVKTRIVDNKLSIWDMYTDTCTSSNRVE